MSNEPDFERLRELSRRRNLDEAEQAELEASLAAHPGLKPDWDADAGLNEALARLANTPVPGNFTARVLQAVQREQAQAARATPGRPVWPRLVRVFPRAAVAGIVLAAGLLSYHQVQAVRRAELAQSVAVVSEAPSVPSPEILQDFDAIRALNQGPAADEQLLVLLQ